MNIHEKMHAGVPYLPNDRELEQEQESRLEMLYVYNLTRPGINPSRTIKL